MLAALDQLAPALASLAPDHPEHARIARRLHALTVEWTERGVTDPLPDAGDKGTGGRVSLDSADDNTVFDFLTNELGIS